MIVSLAVEVLEQGASAKSYFQQNRYCKLGVGLEHDHFLVIKHLE